ncbi:acetyltransferase [Paenibacillus sp. H1-7]|uniref:acyltransferase family protein n=1 Tax=Paenibacillus sp. H1-7 TaxID=2282849 RepID=UPI001EF82A9E|nr:acyltransferase family protein [Paenibacillus sp. H1-7]ULL15882.1 acetyltransferase [Paenibacillus sp. H1-7]
MPKPVQGGSSRYMAGLDGLRALAVLAVIVYHLNMEWAPGGLLGVGVFFVLSGYLITDILISQWKQTGKLDLRSFWVRRARRLLPALLLMLVLVSAWILLFDKPRVAGLQAEVVAGLLYVSNWWLIFRQVSYFESFGPPSPLGHLWSLAVEEQFYLLWPLLLLLGLKFTPRRIQLLVLTLIGAAVSAVAMMWLYEPGTDPSRVYYGTDTRAFGLLIGAVLAMVWPSRRLTAPTDAPFRITLDTLGILALAAIGFMVWNTDEYDGFLYNGGLVLLSLAAAVVVAVIAHPATYLGKVLSNKPLKWIGVRSYGIYLWHYPVIVLTSPVMDHGQVSILKMILQMGVTVLIAALSWRFVEEPIRRGVWRRSRTQAGESRRSRQRPPAARWTPAACVLFLIGFLCVGMVDRVTDATASSTPPGIEAPSGPSDGDKAQQPSDKEEAIAAVGPVKPEPIAIDPPSQPISAGPNNDGGISEQLEDTPAEGTGKPSDQSDGHAADSLPATVEPKGSVAATTDPSKEAGAEITAGVTPEAKPKVGDGITVIGDSVILGAATHLEKQLPGIVIDGKIGRQLLQAADVVKQLKEEGKLGKRVILELGSNGPFTEKQLNSLLESLGDPEQIVLVNTRVPRKWENEVNTILASAAENNPKVKLVDWYAASEGKASIFAQDGVHLGPEGSELYASLIVSALAESKL